MGVCVFGCANILRPSIVRLFFFRCILAAIVLSILVCIFGHVLFDVVY